MTDKAKLQAIKCIMEDDTQGLLEILDHAKSAEHSISRKEPNTLSEICDVTYEYGRAVLTIHDGCELMSRKFRLRDDIQKYEFDGCSMYFYKDKNRSHSFQYSCGSGAYTMVSNSEKRCIRAVKEEMGKKLKEKIPSSLLHELETGLS